MPTESRFEHARRRKKNVWFLSKTYRHCIRIAPAPPMSTEPHPAPTSELQAPGPPKSTEPHPGPTGLHGAPQSPTQEFLQKIARGCAPLTPPNHRASPSHTQELKKIARGCAPLTSPDHQAISTEQHSRKLFAKIARGCAPLPSKTIFNGVNNLCNRARSCTSKLKLRASICKHDFSLGAAPPWAALKEFTRTRVV